MARTIRKKKTPGVNMLRCRLPEASTKLKKGHTKRNCRRCW
jgi:hypothetical protein